MVFGRLKFQFTSMLCCCTLTLHGVETTPITQPRVEHPREDSPISHVSIVLGSDLDAVLSLCTLLKHHPVILEIDDNVGLK